MHLANTASSTAASKRLAISLETKVTKKDKIIRSLEDVVKTKEEQFRLSSKKEAHTANKLSTAESRIMELEAALMKKIEEFARLQCLVEKKTEDVQ